MVWYTVLIKTLPIFILIAAFSVAQPSCKDVDITSLKEHMKKMDVVLQEVQSHAQAQEEQSRALLSSLLSQLTLNTQELSARRNVTKNLQLKFKNLEHDYKTSIRELAELKQSYNDTQCDYMTAMEELTELKQLHNKTLFSYAMTIEEMEDLKQTLNKTTLDLETTLEEFAELKQSNNHSFFKLEGEVESIQHDCLKSDATQNRLLKLNSTETEVLVSLAEIVGQMNATGDIQLAGSKQPWLHQEIGFEAYLADTKHVLATRRVVFDKVPYNEGNGYNKSTGYFTAPVSGTYLFWVNIVYKTDLVKTTVFHIKTGKTVLGHAYGSSNEHFGTASATTISYLKKGERTWIIPSRDVDLQANTPSAGAVLIKHCLSI